MVNHLTREVRGTRGEKLTISRSNVGYRIESNTWTGSGESRGEGAAHEWGSARVEKAKLEEEESKENINKDEREGRVLERVHHDETSGLKEGGKRRGKGRKRVVTATRRA